MRACIVSIGDEVLSGQILNTNASYLASRLSQEGFVIDEQLVTSDFNPGNKDTLLKLAAGVDLIICTGGLGPTLDDMTRMLFADLLNSELVYESAVHEDLKARFGDQPYHRLQAMVPEHAELLANKIGQAPGLLIKIQECWIVAFPGVPHEMKTMFETELVPRLRLHFKKNSPVYEKVLGFFDLLETDIDPFLKKLQEQYVTMSFGIYPSYGTLRLVFKGPCEADIHHTLQFFEDRFKSQIFHAKSGRLEEAIFNILQKKHLTIALAESITGGLLASKLVFLPGISECFLGSFVSYSNELKRDLLGVHQSILDRYGAVSEQTAELMLSGIFLKSSADVGIAVTGIAGPSGGSLDKPLGLVYIAVGKRGHKSKIHRCQFKGDRSMVIEKAATYALGYLMQYLCLDTENLS